MNKIVLLSTICLGASVLCGDSSAQTASISVDKKQVDELTKLLIEQRKKLQQQQESITKQHRDFDSQMQKFNELEARITKVTGKPLTGKSLTSKSSADDEKNTKNIEKNSLKDSVPQIVGEDKKPKKKTKAPEIAEMVNQGGVLLQKGQMVIEPSLKYSNSSATRVSIQGFSIVPALNIGSFEITQVNRDTLTANLATRYGITNRFEVDINVPYLVRSDSTTSRPFGIGSAVDTTSSIDGSDIGDIQLGAHYQINDGSNGLPFFVGNLRFKSTTGQGPFDVPKNLVTGLNTELPTGSGFYSLEPSVTAIISSDPVVFFGNLGYVYNFEDTVDSLGDVKPGDSISASIGMGLSLNEKASFSISYAHNTVLETKINDVKNDNSRVLQVGSLTFGTSYKVDDLKSVNFSVDLGVTEDSPDIGLMLRVPFKFNLIK